jgi:dTDP-4-amino-4,6-dideoxygalactose transaminase
MLEFAGYTTHGVQSGTAALSLAMIVAREARPEVQKPAVILPAYGCPDLIAAAEYAGVLPVLVDTGVDDPGYDLDALADAIDPDIVAVVAVNFLGISERLGSIRALLEAYPGVLLIEDNAQWFPEPAQRSGPQGDLVCLSFGRGKPVSLLGGGALLSRTDENLDNANIDRAEQVGAALSVKVCLYNLLLSRWLYAIANRNPLFELGKTVFKPLLGIRALDDVRGGAVTGAAQCYLAGSRWAEAAWGQVFSDIDLRVSADRRGRLLRYPILCRSESHRDRLWQRLDQAGLGVSAMYRVALPEVEGVSGKFRLAADYTNARQFAGRLLTLPVHEGVTAADVMRAAAIVQATR